jgi:hypothetical protein
MALTVGIIALTLAIINSWHVITAWFSRPPNTVFAGVAHYFADYFLYVAQMQEGTLFTSHWFTNEMLSKTWIYWFNGLVGRIGSILGLSPFATYNVALFLLVLGLCLLWWKLIQNVFRDQATRLVALIFVLTASNFPGLGDFWFSPTPALNRLGGVPHQVFQTILLVSILLTYSRPVVAAPLAFLAATANPIQMLLLVAAFFIVVPRKTIFVALPALAGALLVNREFASQSILMAAKAWETAQPVNITLIQFIEAIGPIVFFLPFGIKAFLKNPDPTRRLLTVFGALSVIAFFLPIPKMFGTSPVRWLGPAAYAFLPLMAAEGLQKASNILHQMFNKRLSTIFASGILVIGFLLLTIPSLFSQVRARQTYQPLNYIPTSVVRQLSELQLLPEGVILTSPALPYDAVVPVLTGHPSFTGHPIHTLYPDAKERLREDYFAGRMTETQAEQFLKDHNIIYVIRGL